MTTPIPPWLETMRQLTGTREVPGAGNNPDILCWSAWIASKYPEMAGYCRQYTNDAIPWCGLTVGYVMAVNGFRPVFGHRATDKFLWANAWAAWGTRLAKPIPGCVMIFTRNGGGHVALYESEDADYYYVRGGNQSDGSGPQCEVINLTRYPRSHFTCAVWPPDAPLPGEAPVPVPPDPAEPAPPKIDPKTPAPTVPPASEKEDNSPIITVIIKSITNSQTFWLSIFGAGGALSNVISALSKQHDLVVIGSVAVVCVFGYMALRRYQAPDIRKGRAS